MPDARGDSGRSAMTRASDALPFRPYVYKGGDLEPTAVIAVRERYRARRAELERIQAPAAGLGGTCAGEAVPDAAPGYEWYRELADGDEMAELTAARDRCQDALAAVPEPGPPPAPPPVTLAGRCGRCGYLTTAAGHRVACDE